METKIALRERYKQLRDGALPHDRMLGSDLICRHLADICAAREVVRVGAFWPFGSEVDLRPLVASRPHLNFFFPRILGTEPARLAWGQQPLGPGAWGLLEPLTAPHPLPPVQLLLVPGLTFARDGHRLGYGKGFYDRVLEALPEEVITLGVGFRFQGCAELPATDRDRPVQGLVDEDGIRWILRMP
jgi:5-formyltetrahydrofolate cyclo-ligase